MTWVWASSDVTTSGQGSEGYTTEALTWTLVLSAVALPLPLWWRRSHPGVALFATVVLGLLVETSMAPPLNQAAIAAWWAVAAAAWSFGCYGTSRVLAVILALGAAGLGVGSALGDSGLAVGSVVAVWFSGLFGHAVGRQRRRVALEQQRRFAELEAESRDRVAWELAQDRIKVARELHDAVGHHLTVIAVQAAASRRSLDAGRGDSQLEQAIKVVEEASRRSLEELRSVVREMRHDRPRADCTLADLPLLLGAVAGVGAESGGAGARVEAQHSGRPRPLTAEGAATAFRVVQESLTNCLRHAPGAAILVQLDWPETDDATPAVLAVTVSNDATSYAAGAHGAVAGWADTGSGIDGQVGTGLVGLRERVTEVGGRLEAGPIPEGGFRVRAELPIDPHDGVAQEPGVTQEPGVVQE